MYGVIRNIQIRQGCIRMESGKMLGDNRQEFDG